MTDKQDAGADNLPDLPTPDHRYFDYQRHCEMRSGGYSAEQVRQAQREAVDAARRAPHEASMALLDKSMKMEAVARGGIDDLMRLHAAFGFAEGETIDADKMIERLAALRAQQPAPQSGPLINEGTIGAPQAAGQEPSVVAKLASALRSANLLLAETFISTGKQVNERAAKVSSDIEQALAAVDETELASQGAAQGRETKSKTDGDSNG